MKHLSVKFHRENPDVLIGMGYQATAHGLLVDATETTPRQLVDILPWESVEELLQAGRELQLLRIKPPIRQANAVLGGTAKRKR